MPENTGEIFKKKTKLEGFCFSDAGDLKPSSILALFQDVAIDHVDANGIGSDDLIKKDLLWVVTQIRYEIMEEGIQDQSVWLKTWFLPPRHGIVQREYLITDQNDEILVKGSSFWVVMNAQTRVIDNRLEEVLEGQKSYKVANFKKRARYLRKFETEERPLKIVTRESAIDRNGHVNNVRYAEYLMEIAQEALIDIKHFQIDYHKEMLCGEVLKLNMINTEKGILVKGSNENHQLVFMSCFS